MSTPDSVNLAKQFSCTLDESPERKRTEILNLQPQQTEAPKWNQTLLVSAIIVKSQDIGKDIVTNSLCKCFRHLQPSKQPFKFLPVLNDKALKDHGSSSQPPSSSL